MFTHNMPAARDWEAPARRRASDQTPRILTETDR
jgi:hypothetical protein